MALACSSSSGSVEVKFCELLEVDEQRDEPFVPELVEALGELVVGGEAVALRRVDGGLEVGGRREHDVAVEDAEAVLVAGGRDVGHALVLVLFVRDGVLRENRFDRFAGLILIGRLEREDEPNLAIRVLGDAEPGLLAEPRRDVLRVREVDSCRCRLRLELCDDEIPWIPHLNAREWKLAELGQERVQILRLLALGPDRRLDVEGHVGGNDRSRARRPAPSPRRRSRRMRWPRAAVTDRTVFFMASLRSRDGFVTATRP